MNWSSRGWRVSPRGWPCFPNTPKGGNGAAPFLRAWGKSLSVRGYVRFYPAAGRASSQVGAAVLARPSAGSQGRRGRRALSAPLRSSLPAGGQRQPLPPREWKPLSSDSRQIKPQISKGSLPGNLRFQNNSQDDSVVSLLV